MLVTGSVFAEEESASSVVLHLRVPYNTRVCIEWIATKDKKERSYKRLVRGRSGDRHIWVGPIDSTKETRLLIRCHLGRGAAVRKHVEKFAYVLPGEQPFVHFARSEFETDDEKFSSSADH